MCTVCIGDAVGRSGGPTGCFTVGRLPVCSSSFLRDGQQPAIIRYVLCFFFDFIFFYENRSDFVVLMGIQFIFRVNVLPWISLIR